MTPITKMKKFLLSVIPALLLLASSAFAACPCIDNVRFTPNSGFGGTWWSMNSITWNTPAGGTVSDLYNGIYYINAPISNADCSYDLLWSTTTWFHFHTLNPASSTPVIIGTLSWDRWWDNCLGWNVYGILVYLPPFAYDIDVAIVETPSWCNSCPCSQAAVSVCVRVNHSYPNNNN